MVYIRRFTPRGSDMVILNTLQGHFAEVTCVCWNTTKSKWITGSEDGTIRIWVNDISYLWLLNHTLCVSTSINVVFGHKVQIFIQSAMQYWGLYRAFGKCAFIIVLQSGEGMNECEQILSAQGSVMSMCLDRNNGAIVAGVEEFIRYSDENICRFDLYSLLQ